MDDVIRSSPATAGGAERSAVRVSLWQTPRVRALLVLGTVGGAGLLLKLASWTYTDLLWFRELGHEDVFWTTLTWKVLAEGVVGFGTAAFLLLNFAVVDRATARQAAAVAGRLAGLWPYRRLLYVAVAVAGGLASTALWPKASWQHLVLWVNRGTFGEQDMTFHRDIGFFVFSLPLYRDLAAWLLETAGMAAVCTVAAYGVAGGLRFARPRAMARATRSHLLALLAFSLVVVAWRLRLAEFELVLPRPGAAFPGPTYTDVHVRLPALRIVVILALAAAALSAYGAVRRVPFRPLVLAAALGGGTLVAVGPLASVVQHYYVSPQTLSRERPYVARAIASTRRAYALDRIAARSAEAPSTLSESTLAANRRTIENVPLWDPGVLRSAMNELESIGTYYAFGSPTVDRYEIGGEPRLVTVAARELDLHRLPREARNWANERFAYTHGYGVAAIEAAGADAERFPSFAQREFGAEPNPLRVREPRIYFGLRPERGPPYRIVPSGRAEVEVSRPGSRSSEYHYKGPGGIPLSDPLTRAAFALRFGDTKLLLSETITGASRIVLRRDARDRLETLVPFLRWDDHVQTAVIGGRVVYLFEGYTTSDHHPSSAPVRFGRDRVNYIREAARASVDAFSGHVDVYAAEAADPILRAWQAAYPGLVRPPTAMPPAMRAHLRYPRELFAAQLKVLADYHVTDPNVFWTREDVLERPRQLAGPVEVAGEIHFPDPQGLVDPDEEKESGVGAQAWVMSPAYLQARLPGERSERFILATPLTPRGRNNLVAYVAGWIDAGGRPRLTFLSLPRDRLTLGPAQATRRIFASPAVSRQLALLNRESRDLGKAAVLRTVLGVPRVVPIGGQLVHVQPVYAAAGGDGVPRLQLVTVHANGRVGYGRDLTSALRLALGATTRARASAADAAPR